MQILSGETSILNEKLTAYHSKDKATDSTINKTQSVWEMIDTLKNHPIDYDEIIIRQLIQTVKVISNDELEIIFKGGQIVTQVSMAS